MSCAGAGTSSRFIRLSATCAGGSGAPGGGGEEETFTEIYSVADEGTTMTDLDSTHNDRAGELIDTGSVLIGQRLKKTQWTLQKSGSPTGNITFTVRDSSDDIVLTMGTLNAASLIEDVTAHYTITAPTSRVLAAGDRILAEYGGGDGSNRVEMLRTADDRFDGAETKRTSRAVGGSYSNQSTHDVCAVFWSSNL